MLTELPVFPLGVVLFPDGVLPLRIFEPRYLTMVGDCMKNNKPFLVTLVKQGKETESGAAFHTIGTLARITDFDQLDDGYLGITCRGESIARIHDFHIQPDKLTVGQLEIFSDQIEPGQVLKPGPEHGKMLDFFRDLLQREEMQPYRQNLHEQWESLDWISYRLAEILPIVDETRQALLEMACEQRIELLNNFMRSNKLI